MCFLFYIKMLIGKRYIDIFAIRKEKREMALTHKCDRCGEVADEVYVFIERVDPETQYEGHGKELRHELCKKCAKKVKDWLSDPYIDMVYKSKPFAPKAQPQEEKKSEDKLSCYDRWKLTQAMQACAEPIGRCLCDLHK